MITKLMGQMEWDEDEYSQQLSKEHAKAIFEESLEKVRPDIGLKILRKSLGLTQAQMSKALDVSRRSYIDYELREKAIPSSLLVLLIVKFDCDLNDLFLQRPRPLSEDQAMELSSRAIDLAVELMSKFPSLDANNRKKIICAILASESDPEYPAETYVEDFVEWHTNHSPKRSERMDWYD